MTSINLQNINPKTGKELIIQNPNILGGKPCLKNTRLSVELIMENLASGRTEEELCYSYPTLTKEGIKAVILYVKSLEENHPLKILLEEYYAISS